MARRTALSLNEWAVLGLVVEVPRHGYEIAGELGPDAEIGEAWTLPRHAVYRALARLEDLGHVEERRTEAGDAAPPRTVYGATAKGRRELRTWLGTPVDHVRDVRSALLLKLLLCERLGQPIDGLVAAQRQRFERRAGAPGAGATPDDVIGKWRHRAVLAVDAFLADLAGPPDGN